MLEIMIWGMYVLVWYKIAEFIFKKAIKERWFENDKSSHYNTSFQTVKRCAYCTSYYDIYEHKCPNCGAN